MQTAALYLRSSKDRHDSSIDAQRRELQALAKAKSLAIVEEFADAVESGKDDQRPGFQALLRKFKDPSRTWSYLLALDTSRIARNQYLAHAVHYECEKRSIKIFYAKVPETNTVMDVVIRAVMQAFDQLHSLMSREKGLSGMAENVKQGWRAGGKAPLGYRLDHKATGAIRDGVAVTKSKLAIAAEGRKVAAYLKARAAGTARMAAARETGLQAISDSTMIGMEWNALTYAGHTVWNVHNERMPGGGYRGGQKRRPRSEWVIQHDTHPALITTEEAETLVSRLDAGRPDKYRTKADYLLSGLLMTPDQKAWHSSGDGAYRVGKGRRVRQLEIEQAVMAQIVGDMTSKSFIGALVKEARQASSPPADDQVKPLRAEINALSAKIGRLADLASESETPRPFLEQIATLERRRTTMLEEVEQLELDQRAAQVLRAMSESDVRRILASVADNLVSVDRNAAKELLAGIVERVELCPETLQCLIHYRIRTGEFVASPRGFEPRLPP